MAFLQNVVLPLLLIGALVYLEWQHRVRPNGLSLVVRLVGWVAGIIGVSSFVAMIIGQVMWIFTIMIVSTIAVVVHSMYKAGKV